MQFPASDNDRLLVSLQTTCIWVDFLPIRILNSSQNIKAWQKVFFGTREQLKRIKPSKEGNYTAWDPYLNGFDHKDPPCPPWEVANMAQIKSSSFTDFRNHRTEFRVDRTARNWD